MKKLRKKESFPEVYILVLNWNGWQDTIECLESLQQSTYPSYRVIVIDNGSTDDSVEHIQRWVENNNLSVKNERTEVQRRNPLRIVRYDKNSAEVGGVPKTEQKLKQLPALEKLVIIESKENLGFAGGNNIGIRYALASGADLIWLLNNDTLVEANTLFELVQFMQSNPDYKGITGQIRLYDQPSVIWNCGGELSWYGTRRYYHSEAPAQIVPQTGYREISFITGCAALFHSSLFNEIGLLSERFFFGEEDFELSQRVRQHNYKLACVYNAIVYHKVSASVNTASSGNEFGKVYVYYLNRFIDMRYFWSKPVWHIWRLGYIVYIFFLLKVKRKWAFCEFWKLSRLLFRNSSRLKGVSRDTFKNSIVLGFGNR